MQLIIKDGIILATHADHQDIRGLYPGCEIVSYNGMLTRLEPLDPPLPDPRTPEQKALSYQDKRRQAYPSVADQLDMIYWDQVNGTTKWRETIAAIKEQYPKGGSEVIG